MRLPVMTVDMGAYGQHEIDFSDYMNISSDLVAELHKDASNYAWIDSVEKSLRKQLELKKIEFETIKGNLTSEITTELQEELGKKPTVKDIDARLDSDDTVVRFKEEILEIENRIAIVGGQLRALTMRHSNIKKLVELSLAEGRMGNLNVNTEEHKEEPKVEKRRGRVKKKDVE
jgi:hypothetical protein